MRRFTRIILACIASARALSAATAADAESLLAKPGKLLVRNT